MDIDLEILDLSGKKLKKLNKPTLQESQVHTLIVDGNELQRLDNLDSYIKVQKLSAVGNQLLRMHGVCRLHSLHTLNLANNGILTIEGLKDLVSLHCLNLAKNNLKSIEHLSTNINLEHLDLSENAIMHVTDLSFLKNLKDLLLHNNRIGHLRQCERFLPINLTTLTLASNNICDLNEISQLVNLVNLKHITLANNPCVTITGHKVGFDYRPFVINWCMNVETIDGYAVDAIESLRGEWLYSQGRGRHFRVGDQQQLSQYLAMVCPLSGEQLESEENRKLKLILSKAQQHQQQLKEQSETPTPSPVIRKKFNNSKYSPRLNSSRLSNRSKSPDRMSSSYYNSNDVLETSNLMTQSLDPNLLSRSINETKSKSVKDKNLGGKCIEEVEMMNSPLQALSKLVPVPESLMSPDYRPPVTIGKMSVVPITQVVPESNQTTKTPCVKSGKFSRLNAVRPKDMDNKRNSPSPVRQRKIMQNNSEKHSQLPKSVIKPLQSSMKKSSSSEEESEVCNAKLQAIQQKVEKLRLREGTVSGASSAETAEKAATCIQKMWRGYYIRNCDKEVRETFRTLQSKRANEYIQKLADDMESTKAALESERKIQVLQMQAINALWKKVSTIQPPDGGDVSQTDTHSATSAIDNTGIVKDLTQTCAMLQNQIQQLQGSMQDIVKFMSMFNQIPGVNQQLKETVVATQTEIVAVHTPQGDFSKIFPFHKQIRPSSLPLPVNQKKEDIGANLNQELRQFAGTLVDDVIKTVSESKGDCFVVQKADVTDGDAIKNNKSDSIQSLLDMNVTQ